MPSSYTTSLRLTLPATGELAGQWGNTVNTGITELLDAAVAGTASISTWGGAGVAYTLSNNSGTADEARKMFIVATGSPGEAKNVICPAVSKFYVFRNDTTGGFALTLKTSGGTGIAVPAGQYKFLYCDGTNVVEMFNSAGALTLSGALSVGGTTTLASNPTLSAGTANQVQFLNASKVLSGSANLTFDGTSLTLGGNPTLSGGTANGVLYLNGSKVATSGSALTYNGSNTLTFDGGSASYLIGPTGEMLIGEDGSGLYIGNGAGGLPAIPILFGSSATTFQRWFAGGTEQMRLTSTGLGIGTSSPGTKLHVTGSNGLFVQFLNSQNNTGEGLVFGSGTNLGRMSTNGASTAMAFEINAVEKARLDSSGNLGLGVTPSAWFANSRAIQMGSGACVGGRSNDATISEMGANQFINTSGTRTYISTAVASLYEQNAGQHRFYTAPSGTAGNTISFTQAMTLDASGYLLVGATSSAGVGISRLQVGSTSAATTQMLIQGASTHLSLYAASAAEAYVSYAVGSALIFGNGPADGSTFTERARITSGGEVYIAGTTDQGAYNLQVNGTGVWGAGAYVNGSDERLKDNIQTLNDGLAVVSQLRPVTFQYKPDHSKDQSVQPGFIAQELQQAMAGKPYLDGVVQSGPEYLNVAYQNLIPILTKAIQEQQALITALTARVAALEKP